MMNQIQEQVMIDQDFTTTHYIRNRASIADLLRPKKRCGIYLLHFTNGEFYIGKAIDVTRRYVQHAKNHLDIEKISFRPARESQLADVEIGLIHKYERSGFSLRNIASTSIPKGETDFDLLMSGPDQDEWLDNLKWIDLDGTRLDYPEQRRKYHPKYLKFEQKQHANEVVQVLQKYVRVGIPRIKPGEMAFWSCTCLPAYSQKGVIIYSRININMQEVFNVNEADGQLGFSFHIARSPLEHVRKKYFGGWRPKYKGAFTDDNHKYGPGGQDQLSLIALDTETLMALLEDDLIIQAIRLFNLRLMKKGACYYNRYHCFDLADRIIG